MKTILYTFADGHKEELEVTDEAAEVFYELEKYEQKVNRKETRRHVSLDMLEEDGFEFADPNSDIETVWEKREEEELEEELAQMEDERLERKQKWLESRLTARQAQWEEKGYTIISMKNDFKTIYGYNVEMTA